MPVLKTLVETETKTRFRNLAKTRGLSESELLRSVVLVVTGQETDADQPIKPEAENSELERMTVRLPGFLMEAAKNSAAKQKEWPPAVGWLPWCKPT